MTTPADPAPETCPHCLRPVATEEQWRTMEEGEGPHLCWGGPGCEADAEGVRERVMEAVRRVQALRPELREWLLALVEGRVAPAAGTPSDARQEARGSLAALLRAALVDAPEVGQGTDNG